ncbi:ArsR family transcriptional regulator [Amycolatopsis sp. NBC_00355]|uniref:ArsR/SmtB family transcription factor n=1 Tax=Amycolatopsis sp. NBC_00355 TaxID=2975957 RepID=UPI002E274F81
MPGEPDIPSVAQAIGEPARAAMLLQLMDGDAHSARALTTVAGIAPSTASSHLRRLCDAGLVHATEAGRQRLHRLAGPEVAHLVEALTALAPPACPTGSSPTRRPGRCCEPEPATAGSAWMSRRCCAKTV